MTDAAPPGRVTDAAPVARPPALVPPDMSGLAEAAAEVAALAGTRAADGALARQGGDAAAGSAALLGRHTANYAAAVAAAGRLPAPPATLVDVGSGTAPLAVWARRRLDAERLDLVDHDARVRRAAAAWGDAAVHPDLDGPPAGRAGLVTAMEVLEHVPPGQQAAFLADLGALAAPGGLVVLSTPDEGGYPGGSARYGPHVGVVDHRRLAALFDEALGWPRAVWRLVGGPFALGAGQRLIEPVANALRDLAQRRAPRLLTAAERVWPPGVAAPAPAPVTTVHAGGGRAAARAGSGLLAVALRPEA